MNSSDFQGIQKIKKIFALAAIAVVGGTIYCFLNHYESLLTFSIYLQTIYMFKEVYFLVLSSLATKKALRIIHRFEQRQKHQLSNNPGLLHAIVIPIYNQAITIIEKNLKQLASHQKAKQNYLIFLAFQAHSSKPKQRAEQLLKIFKDDFKLLYYTIHQLKSGQSAGKHSNERSCLIQMQGVFMLNDIDPSKVMFTTLDCDNLMPEAYFQQVQYFLSRHNWNSSRYIFAPQQMFTINHQQVPLLNRQTDYWLGAVIFLLSNNPTRVMNVASNYSIDYNSFKAQGFFDPTPNGMCDDYHNSLKAFWKREGDVEIVPTFTMINMVSLQTGKGYFKDVIARFWQAERHMKSMQDAAYTLNMLFKNPFKLRTFWASITYVQTHFTPIGFYMFTFLFVILKLITGMPFTDTENLIMQIEFVISSLIMLEYFIVIRRSTEVFFKRKELISWRLFFQQIIFGKFVLFFFMVIPQFIATIMLALKPPRYEAAEKVVVKSYKQIKIA